MSKFLDNHPIALRALILYDIEKARTADRSYSNLCKMIGGNAISEDFDELYGKVIKGKGKILENAPNLRLCILSDVMDKKSIIESFLSITKMIGTQDIDYHDFEFWYNRFSSGNWDLDQKTFYDLPIDIVAKIVEELDIESQMKLRKVSRGLQNIVFQVESSVESISYRFYSSLWMEDYSIVYSEKCKDFSGSRQYANSASATIPFFLKNPKLRLMSFEWNNYSEPRANNGLIELLNSLNHPLEIINLKMIHMTKNAMIALLKAIKPGTLEEIDVLADPGQKTVVDEFVLMNQWKQAKKVTIDRICIDFPRYFDNFHHFEEFNISVESITLKDLLNMKMADL
uniref:F-box domain-containing protein n=1 Tax=Caenorhabditis tropicalis TaxID=1561998 RepID=A0A1I7UIA6_9PELO